MPKFRYMLVETGKPAVFSPEDDYGSADAARTCGNAAKSSDEQMVVIVEDRSDEIPKFAPQKASTSWAI